MHRTAGSTSTSCPFSKQHFLALAAPAHVDRAAQLVLVVDVQRPAQFEHHVVGDVHQRRDRALAGALEALAHPRRGRRRGIHIADYAPGEPSAAVGIVDFDGMRGFALAGMRLIPENFNFSPVEGRNLACDSQHRQAVRAIRRQLEGQYLLIEPERLVRRSWPVLASSSNRPE